ncbi:hypothetical protein [Yellowstone lake phycodnavirus 3]|uniref:hypothetical protein n=1 Tax=Yellowstone lake phycodnavirus 3 TaxID=1586715 RepID=UPI0006EB4CC6|nr:hypothetical protein AR677_gp091 [Yellowstone lake phycodnavirus 3]BAT22590.1 hypothetical protein [Yellowstone lake phycodnavirus 3]
MATVSFTLPMNPVMISAAKKKGSVLGVVLNVVILAALVAFIWWFYNAMQKSSMTPAPPVDVEAAPPVDVEAAPPVDVEAAPPDGAEPPESVPSADV